MGLVGWARVRSRACQYNPESVGLFLMYQTQPTLLLRLCQIDLVSTGVALAVQLVRFSLKVPLVRD